MDSQSIEEQPCGCRTDGTTYEPCFSCALINAGDMLQQAGLRLREAEEQRLADAEAEAAAIQARAEATIGGSD